MNGHDIPDSLPDGFGEKPDTVKAAIERASVRANPTLTQIANSKVHQSLFQTFDFEIGPNLAGTIIVLSLVSLILAWILR